MRRLSLNIELNADERWLGGVIYIENLLAALMTLPKGDRPRVRLWVLSQADPKLVGRLTRFDIVQLEPQTASIIRRGWAFLNRLSRGRLAALASRLPLRRASCHELWFPVFGRSGSVRPELYWIPDFQHHSLPHLFSQDELDMRSRCFAGIAQDKGSLLLSSRTALRDFTRNYPEAKVTPCVWSFYSNLPLNESSAIADVSEKYRLPDKFLYIPNQFWKHKDHLSAFEALRMLRARGCEVPLVCTGYQGDYRHPDYFDSVKAFLVEHGLDDHVRLLGIIPREDQIAVFRKAAAILQPSLFEGWSTVVEDAKALGRPIVASDIEVHREQLEGEPGVHYFKAGDAQAMADCIEAVWPSLKPGPDEAAEQEAQARTARRRFQSAKEFMAIVAGALQRQKFG